jgi:hypothetical protein
MNARMRDTNWWYDHGLWIDVDGILDDALMTVVALTRRLIDLENEVVDDGPRFMCVHDARHHLRRLAWLHVNWVWRVDRAAPIAELGEALAESQATHEVLAELASMLSGLGAAAVVADDLVDVASSLVAGYRKILSEAAETARPGRSGSGRQDGGA